MLGAAAWIYNLSRWIYRVRAVWDRRMAPAAISASARPVRAVPAILSDVRTNSQDGGSSTDTDTETAGCGPRPQLHVIVCTVYEIGVAVPVIATEYVLFGCVVQPMGMKLIAYFEP